MSDPVQDGGPEGTDPDAGTERDQSPAEVLNDLFVRLRPANDVLPETKGAFELAEIPLLKKSLLRRPTGETQEANTTNTERAQEQLSPELKAFVEQSYRTFRTELTENLNRVSELTKYPPDGLGSRNSTILEEINFDLPDAHTKAILQMDYAKHWSKWVTNLDNNNPAFLTVDSFLKSIPAASDAYDQACENIEHINTEKLAQRFRFGFHSTNTMRDPSPTSLATLFVEAAQSTDGVKVYKKSALMDAIESRTNVAVMQNDRLVDHPARRSDVYLSTIEDARRAYGAIGQRRTELILAGDVFIKPESGARSFGVQKLSYNQETETMTLKTKTPLAPQILKAQSTELGAYLHGDRSVISSIHGETYGSDEAGDWLITLNDGTEVTVAIDPTRDDFIPEANYTRLILKGLENPSIAELLIEENRGIIEEHEALPASESEQPSWSLTLYDGSILVTTSDPDSEGFNPTTENTRILHEQTADLSCGSVALLDGLHFTSVDEDTYHIQVPRERLNDFFIGLEVASIDASSTVTYAEEAIPVARLNGNTWEIRQVNQAAGLERLLSSPAEILQNASALETERIADYVKMSNNSAIASISLGDTGRRTDEVLDEVLKQIEPEITEEDTETLITRLREKREAAGLEIQRALSDHLTERKNELLPDYPIDRIAVDSFSSDFMIVAELDEETGKVRDLHPVLVDVNFYYGVKGLRQADAIDSIVVTANQRRLKEMVRTALNAV